MGKMKKSENTAVSLLPVLAGFFIMGFCDIVGITSDYVQNTFGWSSTMTGFVPSMVFVWFLFLGIPVGNAMNRWGRKNTVLISMAVTVIGMFLPLVSYNGWTCMVAYALLGIGNAILQVSLNPLLGNVVKKPEMLTSSLTAGQVIKAVSSLVGPEIVILAVAWFGADKWYFCFPILGAVTILSALWLMLTPIEKEERSEGGVSFKETFGLLRDRTILVLFLGILFVVGTDVGTNFLSSKFMSVKYGWGAEDAKFAPQVYFFSRTVGALLGAVLLSRISGVKYFRVNILLCVASVVGLILFNNEVAGMVCIGGIGFFASSVFSIIYSVALSEKPDKANQISGLMITAVAGGGIVTPLMGMAIDGFGMAGGVVIILLCSLYLTYCAFTAKKS